MEAVATRGFSRRSPGSGMLDREPLLVIPSAVEESLISLFKNSEMSRLRFDMTKEGCEL